MITQDEVDAVMRWAVARRRSSGTFYATITGAEHLAWADGEDAGEALARLRTAVEEEFARIVKALRVIWEREVAA